MGSLGREIGVTLADGRALVVRDARKRDARGVCEMLDAVAAEPRATLVLRPGEATPGDWRRRIAEALRSYRGLFLVADGAGAVVGNLGLWPDANPASAHVAWIGMSVAAGWRGVGAGGALLEAAVEWAASAGFQPRRPRRVPRQRARHRLLRAPRLRAGGAAHRPVPPRRRVS